MPKERIKTKTQAPDSQYSSGCRTMIIRRLKRIFLPLHRTLQRFIILTGCGIILFILYVQLLNIYVKTIHISKYPKSIDLENTALQSRGSNKTRRSFEFKSIHESPTLSSETYFFLILTCSSPWDLEHRNRREAIRKTWGNCKGSSMKGLSSADTQLHGTLLCRQVFFMGRSYIKETEGDIANEAHEFGDILVSNVYDSYKNITWKLLTALKWAAAQKFMFLVKTDDDVYIQLPMLQDWLIQNKPTLPKDFYGGVLYKGVVVRDRSHKHYVSMQEYNKPRYPLYCKGSQFVLSGHLVSKLVETSSHIKRFSIDDAYVGIVLHKMGLVPTSIPRFVQFKFMYVIVDFIHYCDLSWLIGIGDSLRPHQLKEIHVKVLGMEKSATWACLNLHPFIFISGLVVTFLVMFFVTRTHFA